MSLIDIPQHVPHCQLSKHSPVLDTNLQMKHLHRYKFERFLTATYQIHYLLNLLCVVPSGADVENCTTSMCPWVRLFLTGFVKLYFDVVDHKSFATHYPSKKCHRVDLIK